MFRVASVFGPSAATRSAQEWRADISPHYCVDEAAYLSELIDYTPPEGAELCIRTQDLVTQVRQDTRQQNGIAAFLHQYNLSTQEGIILMSLAEALLRIPDSASQDALIKDKLATGDWTSPALHNNSRWLKAANSGLARATELLSLHQVSTWQRLLARLGKPLVRASLLTAMKMMGQQFVLGRTIEEALNKSTDDRRRGYSHSYDMLGEAAMSAADAALYYQAYFNAITAIGEAKFIESKAGKASLSIKLSALHPRFQEANRSRILDELYDSLLALLKHAKAHQVQVTIDAEEMDRLELTLDLFAQLYHTRALQGWGGFGLVVQAYSKRALATLAWLAALARAQGDEIPLRLVKGAYWDSEIKLSQQAGLAGYSVFTRKAATDISYLVCARFLLSETCQHALYPQFATHNAHTVLAIHDMAQQANYHHFEFQRLHGMGEALYDILLKKLPHLRCRIYAPVGAHRELLPYLVRRLLENGANSSFVHQLADPKTQLAELAQHPLAHLAKQATLANAHIPLPPAIFNNRINSAGLNLNIASQRAPLLTALAALADKQWQACSLLANFTAPSSDSGLTQPVLSPHNTQHSVGRRTFAQAKEATFAITQSLTALNEWRAQAVAARASILVRLADLLESHQEEFISLCTREAGKLLQDGIDEVREAVDFCRYYAQQANTLLAPHTLAGYTGESNVLYAQGRGVFICISPWNFPLAIFIGQVSAALVTGNTVIAKPAPQTCLIAHLATQLAHQAGVPKAVLQLLLGGSELGQALVSDPRIGGVCFTGSHATAQHIHRTLAHHHGAIIPLIAETGGQNAMIVDSSALPEQVVQDVLRSAFQSAGQRCSALRVLYLQSDISERILTLLSGAMAELSVGDPALLATDVGPLIDPDAHARLSDHLVRLQDKQVIARTPLPANASQGHYFAPIAMLINSIKELSQEHFGPVLHVIIYQAEQLEQVIDDINDSGYGLTLGIHSRNQTLAQHIAQRATVGNVYINRDQIGAMVGVQPFGGQGLSGTGPKAGGPHYLTRFIIEKTITNNTTAIGGNASLLTLDSQKPV